MLTQQQRLEAEMTQNLGSRRGGNLCSSWPYKLKANCVVVGLQLKAHCVVVGLKMKAKVLS